MSWVSNVISLFSFRRISGQIAALILVSLILIHVSIAGYFLFSRPQPRSPADDPIRQFELVARIIVRTPPAERQQVLQNIDRAFPDLRLHLAEKAPTTPLARDLPSRGKMRPFEGQVQLIPRTPPDKDSLILQLSDGNVLEASVGKSRPPPFFTGPWMTTLMFLFVSISLLGIWAGRALSAPLSAFARAAESFSLNGSSPPLPENGPQEIRSAARALNAMRERITALMNDRTRMLAAISHDLRTPITRLRLRSEFIEDEAYRQKTLSDLDQMQAMLEAVLTLLRSGSVAAATRVDVAALVQLVCNEFLDSGSCVTYQGPSRLVLTVKPDEIRRVMNNLIENAVRHGSKANVSLVEDDETARITVSDNGPGIPDDKKAAMLEPFVRGDEARTMEKNSGFGLGLSIAQMIVQAHGGSLLLHDNSPQGLSVSITLPYDTARPSRSKRPLRSIGAY